MATLERTEALPALKHVPLFAGLTPPQLRRVAEVSKVKRSSFARPAAR